MTMTRMTGRLVAAATLLIAVATLVLLYGATLNIETRDAAPALAAVGFRSDRPPPPADPPATVTTVVTQTTVITVTATAPTTVTATSTTTVVTTVVTTVTSSVPGATSTVYSCGAGYHYAGGLCVGNGPVVN
jgi:hypothetical protein